MHCAVLRVGSVNVVQQQWHAPDTRQGKALFFFLFFFCRAQKIARLC
jgi:hypothetical protein